MRIFGYAGDPSNNYQVVEWGKLTHVAINGLMVTSATNPTIQDSMGANYTILTNIRDFARAVNPNIKVLCMLGGGGWQGWDLGHLTAIMANTTYRNTLAINLAAFVTTYSLDGIDLDWEGDDVVQANYHAFLVALRAALPVGKIISVCGAGAFNYHPWFNASADSPYIDFYNIMSYGFSYNDFTTYLSMWFSAGFPAEKLNFGYSVVEDDISLISSKIQWALSNNVGGQMLWSVDAPTADGYLSVIYGAVNPMRIVAYYDESDPFGEINNVDYPKLTHMYFMGVVAKSSTITVI
jgi:chitinase